MVRMTPAEIRQAQKDLTEIDEKLEEILQQIKHASRSFADSMQRSVLITARANIQKAALELEMLHSFISTLDNPA